MSRLDRGEPNEGGSYRHAVGAQAVGAARIVGLDILPIPRNLSKAEEFGELLVKIEIWRNRYVAHNTEKPRLQRKLEDAGVEIARARWSELERAIELTSEIVGKLWLVIDQRGISTGDRHKVWGGYASFFWGQHVGEA